MRDFLTVEDVNSVQYANQGFYWHEIDISKITTDPTEEFTDVKYDCFKIKREYNSNLNRNEYTVLVHSSLWTKGAIGLYIDERDVAFAEGVGSASFYVMESLSRPHSNFKIYVYMGHLEISRMIGGYLIENTVSLNLKQLNQEQQVEYIDWGDGNTYSSNWDLSVGYNEIVFGGGFVSAGYLLVNLLKTDFQFTCNQSLTVGKVNKVYLGANADYKPSGALVGEYTPNITVTYNGETLSVSYDETQQDYYFNLDLTDKTETGKIRFTVNVEANEVLNSTSTDVALNSQYQTVNTFDALISALSVSDVIRLGANMTATANISINKSIKIIGNDKTIDLDSHRFILKEDVEFKAENLQLDNGDTTIIQAKNTIVNLTGVTFTNCTSTNYNGLGSCIFCDVDVDSLDNTEDYATTLTECTFTNNANCILHGGQLTIKGCTLDNNSITNINTNNPTFIYQTDGTCLIQQSTFNIDYDYTSAEANIGYAQALIMCGETANINGATHTDLQTDNSLPFFDAPFNNRANLYAKYYYPQITDNVESITTVTDKGCCYSASGVDWVFKNNIQVRRVE